MNFLSKNIPAFILVIIGFAILLSGVLAEELPSFDIEKTINPTPSLTSANSIKDISDTSYEVKEVVDGDTIVLTNGQKVRYLGVNTPEKGQPYSQKAIQVNKEYVLGKKLTLETDVQQKDRYGRTLAYVYLASGDMVNEELIKKGYAIVETIPPNVKYQKKFLEAQKEARTMCSGMWEGLCFAKQNKICLKIDSINYDAQGDDSKNKNDEWIKIKNTCNNPMILKGFLLKDNSASNVYTFPNYMINSQGSVFIHSGCGEDTQDHLYWACPEQKNEVWNNTSDSAYLFNDKDELVAEHSY